MAEQLAGFPKEFELHFSDVFEKELMLILFITSAILIPMMVYLQGLPPKELSQEDLEKLIQVIYRVEPQPEVVKTVKQEDTPKARKVDKAEVEEKTAEEKRERKKEQKKAREARRAKAQQAARSRGIFAQAGAISAGSGRRKGGRTLGGSGLSGVSASGLAGIATGTEVAKVEKLRGGGALTEGAGDIDIAEMSLEEIELMLEGSSVEIEEIPEVKGSAASSAARDPGVIQNVIQTEQSTLKDCYNTYKRQDANLQGRMVIRFTITAAGSASRVQFRKVNWSNPTMGKKVEQCIKRRIARWRFDPASGDVTTEFTLVLT